MKTARRQTARPAGRDDVPGLAARRVAADILDAVLRQHRPVDVNSTAPAPMPGLPVSPIAIAR